MPKPLFTNGEAKSDAYRTIRDAKDGPRYYDRLRCERYWSLFGPYADDHFLKEFRDNFHARYWEMHLTTSLILNGYEVTCPKPAGPDVGIKYQGRRIWFEAVSPGPGDPQKPDYVAEPKDGHEIVSCVPQEKMLLRYLNSISEKYERQYATWLKNGHVSKEDAFIIALNPRSIPFDHADTNPPRILQVAYRLGSPYVALDGPTGQLVDSGYRFRCSIKKESRTQNADDATKAATEVSIGVFQDEKYKGLSGLLCSRVDAANYLCELDGDYQLAPNPHADVPLPATFRFRGTYYAAEQRGDCYEVTWQKVELPS